MDEATTIVETHIGVFYIKTNTGGDESSNHKH